MFISEDVKYVGVNDTTIDLFEGQYGEQTELTPLDDSQEKEANDYICHRFLK